MLIDDYISLLLILINGNCVILTNITQKITYKIKVSLFMYNLRNVHK